MTAARGAFFFNGWARARARSGPGPSKKNAVKVSADRVAYWSFTENAESAPICPSFAIVHNVLTKKTLYPLLDAKRSLCVNFDEVMVYKNIAIFGPPSR